MSLWLRLGLGTFVFSALAVGLALGVWACMPWIVAARIAAAERELDASDPGWRLEDVYPARSDVPDGENSAPLIRRLVESLPKDWPDAEWPDMIGYPVNATLDEGRRALIKKLLAPVEGRRAAARALSEYPRGRHRIRVAETPYATELPHVLDVRWVGWLLHLDALDTASRGDIDGALVAVRAALNVARSLHGEPFHISHSALCTLVRRAARDAERALGQGVASDAGLAALQKALAPHTRDTGLVEAMRGNRAETYRALQMLASGELAPEALKMKFSQVPGFGPPLTAGNIRERGREFQPAALRLLSRAVDVARLPPPEQANAEELLYGHLREPRFNGPLLHHLAFGHPYSGERSRHALTAARATHALAACERYRLKSGRWPGRLADLVPAYLDAVPDDPNDSVPLRYVREASGVAIHAATGGDVRGREFRLWDVDKSRRRASTPNEGRGAAVSRGRNDE